MLCFLSLPFVSSYIIIMVLIALFVTNLHGRTSWKPLLSSTHLVIMLMMFLCVIMPTNIPATASSCFLSLFFFFRQFCERWPFSLQLKHFVIFCPCLSHSCKCCCPSCCFDHLCRNNLSLYDQTFHTSCSALCTFCLQKVPYTSLDLQTIISRMFQLTS